MTAGQGGAEVSDEAVSEPLEDRSQLPSSGGWLLLRWDDIVRTYGDAAIDRSALGLLSIIASLLFGSKVATLDRDGSLSVAFELIDRNDCLGALSFVGIFFVLWFAGRIVSRLAPPAVSEWKIEDNYVSMKIRQIEKDDVALADFTLGRYTYRQEQTWRKMVSSRPVIRSFMTVLIRTSYLALLISFLLICRATFRFLAVTIQNVLPF